VSGRDRTPAAVPRPRGGHRDDVVRGIAARLAALRGGSTGRTQELAAELTEEAVLEALPAGLRTLDVMELSFEAVRTAVLRHTLAAHPPDVLITVPRSSCRTLDFHRAEEMIGLGRRLAIEALEDAEDRCRCVV